MRAIVLLLAVSSGCGRLGFDASSGTVTDAPADVSFDALVNLTWGPPRVLSELVVANAVDEDPSITADRLTIVWASERGGSGQRDIYMATRASPELPFSNLTSLPFNTASDDGGPEITADGSRIYYIDANDDVSVSDAPFTTSARDPGLSSAGPELDVAISPDQLTAMLNRGNQLMLATRTDKTASFGAFEVVAELDITADVASPSITNGAAIVYFHLGTPRRDLYRSHRLPDGSFAPPEAITELNTALRDADPFILEGLPFLLYNCDAVICISTPQ